MPKGARLKVEDPPFSGGLKGKYNADCEAEMMGRWEGRKIGSWEVEKVGSWKKRCN